MTTMQDVARHAGVSVMTVSNVINERAHVRSATRDRVQASIAELGYHVNATARSLRQGRSKVIGLAVPEIDRPYFGHLAALIIDRAALEGYEIVVEQTGAGREGELGALMHSRLRSYDGLIMSVVGLADADARFLRTDVPVLLLGERDYSQSVDQVHMDNGRGGGLAAEHLIARGARQLAMIGGSVEPSRTPDAARLRADAYVAVAAAKGVPIAPSRIVDTPYTFDGGYRATMALLDASDQTAALDGIFCATDLVAIGAIRALRDRGLRVPEDVLVVGFDNVPLAAFLVPSLTSVAPDHEGMADAAVSLLTRRISGERGPEDHEEYVARVRLVERESTRR